MILVYKTVDRCDGQFYATSRIQQSHTHKEESA